MISGVFRGGEVHVALKGSAKSNRRQKVFWKVARSFGDRLLENSAQRAIGLSGLPVWSCNLLIGAVGARWCYWIFCHWPGQPKVWTVDFDQPEPQSVDELLSTLKVHYAEPIHAFRLPLRQVDADDDPITEETINGLTEDYLDHLLGVKRRAGDEPSESEFLLAVEGKSTPQKKQKRDTGSRVGWRVRMRPTGDVQAFLLEAFRSSSLQFAEERGYLYLRSDDFAGFSAPMDVFNHATKLLRIATGVLHLWGLPGVTLEAENAEMVNADGSVEGLMTSVLGSAAVLSRGGKKALLHRLSGVSQERLVDLVIPVALSEFDVRRALNLLSSADCGWADLYTALEIASSDLGGKKAIVARGWASAAEIKRLKHTANTTEFGRHGRAFSPPGNPMTLVEARQTVLRILRGWIADKAVQVEIDLQTPSRRDSDSGG